MALRPHQMMVGGLEDSDEGVEVMAQLEACTPLCAEEADRDRRRQLQEMVDAAPAAWTARRVPESW